MWRKLRLLSNAQVFAIASVSSGIIATPFAVASISHDETAWLRDFPWPHQFVPFITFAAVFLALLPILLSYYHLGRLGAMLSLVASPFSWYAMTLVAFLAFVLLRNPVYGAAGFGGVCVIVFFVVFGAHIKAAKSENIGEAQRKLHLTR